MSIEITQDDLQIAKAAAVRRWLRPIHYGNVVGVGIGKKFVDDQETPQDCVRIYVSNKFYPEDLWPSALVP